MEKAVEAVQKGNSLRKTAEMYNVPRSTLHDRVTGKIPVDGQPGRQPYLSVDEEEELVCFLLKCASIGYAHTRKEVLLLVRRIVERSKAKVSVMLFPVVGGEGFANAILT